MPSISISEAGVTGSWTLASRSPLLSASSASSRQTSATPISGRPGSLPRLQPSAAGVQTSNTGRNSSRMEITSRPSAQKKCCTARRGPARTGSGNRARPPEIPTATCRARCRTRKSASPTVHGLRGFTASQSPMKFHLGVGRKIELLARAGFVTKPQIVD